MTSVAKIFACSTVMLGCSLFLLSLQGWHCQDYARFGTMLVLACFASRIKVRIPGYDGTLTASLIINLIGVLELSEGELVAMAVAAVAVQVCFNVRVRPGLLQILFNLASASTMAVGSFRGYHAAVHAFPALGPLALLALLAGIYFLLNISPIAIILSLTGGGSIIAVCRKSYLWSFPFYLGGACVAGIVHRATESFGWQVTFLALPLVYVFHRSYQVFTGRLEDSRRHAEELGALHLRSINALALAIEAKDDTTHSHLHRVQTYALAIGRDLGLSQDQLDALQAASILHDIGKLAVPEYIISKPGKLTPEEFEKMKVHTIVGAEIVERVEFPYPVAPLVRGHHEKWNGTGYPDGLRGEQIPLGARILAAVDCFDALATDRQYRRALPLNKAMEIVAAEAGKAFDPQVVAVLERRYRELEVIACGDAAKTAKLSVNVKIARGDGPDAGFERSAHSASVRTADSAIHRSNFLAAISSVRSELRTLLDVSAGLSNALRLEDLASFLSNHLQELIPHDTIAIFERSSDRLSARCVHGEDAALLATLHVPVGQGLVGWVAETHNPILNGNPSVEAGTERWKRSSVLQAALVVPLNVSDTVVGVLAFYSRHMDNFHRDHVRVLDLIAPLLVATFTRPQQLQDQTSAPVHRFDQSEATLLTLDTMVQQALMEGRTASLIRLDLEWLPLSASFDRAIPRGLMGQFSECVRQAFGPGDGTVRLADSEFAVLTEPLCPAAFENRLQALRTILRSSSFATLGHGDFLITAGVAELPRDGQCLEELLAFAERKLHSDQHTQTSPPATSDGTTTGLEQLRAVVNHGVFHRPENAILK